MKEALIHFFYFYGLQTFQKVQIVHLVPYIVMDKTITQDFQQFLSDMKSKRQTHRLGNRNLKT